MPITGEKKIDKYRIRVLDRTFDLLDALAESEYPMGTADLCKRARLSKSTVHRLLMVLETRKLVEREGRATGTGSVPKWPSWHVVHGRQKALTGHRSCWKTLPKKLVERPSGGGEHA